MFTVNFQMDVAWKGRGYGAITIGCSTEMPFVPRIGDVIDPGYGDAYKVGEVFWQRDDGITVYLEVESGHSDNPEMTKLLLKRGWTRVD